MGDNRIRKVMVCLAFVSYASMSFSQNLIINHNFDNQAYMAHIKSLDEFIQRMNGNEVHPLVEGDDSMKVRITRYTLFDRDLLNSANCSDSILSICEKFIDFLESDTINVSVENLNNWVEAKCRFIWENTEKELTLKMQLEVDSLRCWRWALVDIDGLHQSGLLDDTDILRISPVEHEINYMELESLFQYDYKKMVGTRKEGMTINQLSYFFGLIYSGLLKYDMCKSVEFHCRQVPGYYFVVKEMDRLASMNSGWLIVSLIETD